VTTKTTHVHKWLMEPDKVTDVHGYCVRCGDDRLFAGTRAAEPMRGFNPRSARKAAAK